MDNPESNTKIETRSASDAKADRAQAAGEEWVVEHQLLVDSLPVGTVIAINVADGRHVTGRSGLEAMDAFEIAFGLDALAWLHKVGGPITVGGGWWAISSAV